MMPRNDSDSTDDSFRPTRRSYLKAAGAAAVSVPLLAGEGAAATERHGISFHNVVDMVNDAGCDPNGNEACDGKLQSAAGSDTLLKFPSGTYKFTQKNLLEGYDNFGILGEGDATFTVPDNFDDKLLAINYGSSALVENITIDQSGATPNIHVAPNDDLQIHGLKMLGQGIDSSTGQSKSDSANAANGLTPMVRSSGGKGMIEDIVLHNEGRMGAYSRVGVWIGKSHKGTLTLRNCNVEGFSSNGVYASRTPGVVKIEGGLYKNNDQAQVRIGSAGSYIDGATAVIDASDSRSPNPEGMTDANAFRIEKPGSGDGGATIRNCDVRMGEAAHSGGGIKVYPNYGSFTIEDTRIEYNGDGYAIRASTPDGSGDVDGTLKNVSVTGDASGLVGVLIEGRPNTTVEGCCVQQTGSGRTGLALDNCDGSTVKDCTLNAGAQALRIRNGNVTTSGISTSGSCPAPNLSSSSYSNSSSSDSSSNSNSSSSNSSASSESSGNLTGSGSDNSLSGNTNGHAD